jgi:integrase
VSVPRTDRDAGSRGKPARRPQGGRPKKGNIVKWTRANGDVGYGLRFLDQYGERQYERCGLESEGWSRRRAEIELEHFHQLVDAGIYVPTADIVASEERNPYFGAFARSFLAEHGIEIRANTRDFYANLLHNHLDPYFGKHRLSEVSWSAIDGYKKQRLMLMQRYRLGRETGTVPRGTRGQVSRLSERTINHSIELLSLILEEAVRRPDVALTVNEARDKKLRVKVPKTKVRDWLEPDEVVVLLEAAELIDNPVRPETERKAIEVRRLRDQEKLTISQIAAELEMSEGGVCWLYERRRVPMASQRRAIIATLTASGTRNTELCALCWKDLDFKHGKIRIRSAKTNTGVREIDMTPWLREQLLAYKAARGDLRPEAPVFPTRNETFRNKDNLNRRVIAPVQRAAAELLERRKLSPLPTDLSAHVFRRTYATLMAEAGAPPRYVQRQLGHGSARLTLEVYTRVSDSRDRTRLGRAFDELMAGAVPPEVCPPAESHGLADLTMLESRSEQSAAGMARTTSHVSDEPPERVSVRDVRQD